jgi:hypothetical protein
MLDMFLTSFYLFAFFDCIYFKTDKGNKVVFLTTIRLLF